MTDNCPNCCHGPNEPQATRTDHEQRTDRYRCPNCGHSWTTRRAITAYDQPATARPAATPPAA